MDTEITAALITAAGAVLAAVLTVVARRVTLGPVARKSLAVVGFLAVALVAYGAWLLFQPDPAELNIANPSNDDLVAMSTRMSGTSTNLPDKDSVMLVVYWREGQRYYPAAEQIDFETDGDWSIWASVGQEGDAGAAFDLIVVSNDAEAQADLKAYLADVEAADGDSPGLEELPEGSQRLATVSVTRSG